MQTLELIRNLAGLVLFGCLVYFAFCIANYLSQGPCVFCHKKGWGIKTRYYSIRCNEIAGGGFTYYHQKCDRDNQVGLKK